MMVPIDPGGLWGAPAAAVIGGGLGWLLMTITGRWLAVYEAEMAAPGGVPSDSAPRPGWSIPIAGAIVAIVLWWWEVRAFGEMPLDEAGQPLLAEPMRVGGRLLAHLVLVWLLGAATWIDFRFRVIPDWITTPGAIAGLVATWLFPSILLPVATELPRPFATPIFAADVLGWAGPLAAFVADAGWNKHPPLAALAAALGMFSAWWYVCTASDDPFAPADAEGSADQAGHGAEDGTHPIRGASGVNVARLMLLAAGLIAVSAAGSVGGERFAALFTALVGIVVSGGIVWATRAGASVALGREAMGLGDVTLMAMVGAWLGWQACVLASFLGVLFGLVHGLAQMIRNRENELPFGPSLCAGTIAVIVGWRWAWASSAASFAQPGQLATVVVSVVAGTALTLSVWSRLGPSSRRIALAGMLILTLLLLVWILLLSGGAA